MNNYEKLCLMHKTAGTDIPIHLSTQLSNSVADYLHYIVR